MQMQMQIQEDIGQQQYYITCRQFGIERSGGVSQSINFAIPKGITMLRFLSSFSLLHQPLKVMPGNSVLWEMVLKCENSRSQDISSLSTLRHRNGSLPCFENTSSCLLQDLATSLIGSRMASKGCPRSGPSGRFHLHARQRGVTLVSREQQRRRI